MAKRKPIYSVTQHYLMKTLNYLFLLILLCSFANAQPATKHKFNLLKEFQHTPRQGTFIYELTTSIETYNDLTGTTSVNNGEIWDDPEYVIGLPFDFLLNETVINSIQFYGVGGLLVAPTGEPDLFAALIPFETDLLDRGMLGGVTSLSPISYTVDGNPGSRIFKLEFKNAGSYNEFSGPETMDMFINFQMWLYEGSNLIQYRFGPHSIEAPIVFYGGEPGAYIGTVDYDEANDIFSNTHFITGNATKPTLTSNVLPVTGTPPNGMVYSFSMGDLIIIEVNAQNNTSYCNPNGVIDIEVTGGTPPYTYEWNNGATSQDLQNVTGGTYSLTVTDQVGLTATTSVTVSTTVMPMTLDVSSTIETAEDANDGTASVLAMGGLQPYTYLWSNGATTSTIGNLAPGAYTVTVTDNADCSEVADVVINSFGCPELILEIVADSISCIGNCDGAISIDDVINGVAPYSYEWSNGETDASINNLCAGSYSVTVIDNNNCIVTDSWTLSQPQVLNANATATSETITGANDGTAISNPTGGTPTYTYLWSNGSTSQQINGLSPGTYSVIVTDINNCIAYDTVTVLVGPCALLTATVTDVSCNGSCDGSIVLDGTWTSIQWNTGSTSNSINDLCIGDYSVTVTDNTGCTVESTYTINQPDSLVANTGSTSETEQGGDGTAWVVPQGGTVPYTYLWSNGSTDSLITGLVADIYSVTLTDANGCIDTASVVVSGSCVLDAETSGRDASCYNLCDGYLVVDTVYGVGPFQYHWSTGDTTKGIYNLCAGQYTVIIADLGQPGCAIYFDFIIGQPDSMSLVIDVVHLSDTSEASIDIISVNGGTPPYQYEWLGPNQVMIFEEDIAGISPGTYLLTITDANGCEITRTVEVFDFTTGLPPLQDNIFSIYPNPATTIINIETNLPGDYSVELYSTLGMKIGSWKNARTIDISGITPGMYVVRIDNAEGYYVKRIVME